MRELTDAARLHDFMRALGREAAEEGRVYLTGGATAVLIGWRATTIDVDMRIVPESDDVLRCLPRLKEELRINVELAWPEQFVPALSGWEDRSPRIVREGRLSFHHYDFYSQALSKLERGHRQDLDDVSEMRRRDLVKPDELLRLYGAVEAQLYRYPAVNPATLRSAVESFAQK